MSDFDEDIDRLREIRNFADFHLRSDTSAIFLLTRELNSDSSRAFLTGKEEAMGDRTLKDLASPQLDRQPWCFQVVATFELKLGVINALPKFHCFANEDPNKHLMEFCSVVTNMKPKDVDADEAILKAFPFSLVDITKEWLYYLPFGPIATWRTMKKFFIEMYFPASEATQIRKEICGFRQIVGETLYDYWERYNRICASYPHHQIGDQLIIEFFYGGLSLSDRNLLDAASGGALVNKTIAQARELIENMIANSQQFSIC